MTAGTGPGIGPGIEPDAALADDLRLAGELVRDAGRLAARMRADGLETGTKSSVSDLVTDADTAAERLVTDRLARDRPDDGQLAEEGTTRESRSGRRWVVDPVDGTYNFVAGLDWWCSAVALEAADGVRVGAIYHPARDELYAGGPGLGVTRNGAPLGEPLPDVPLDHAGLATYLAPALTGTPVAAAHARVVGGVAAIRMLGSGSMDLVTVARGGLALFCQQSVTPWDWLPGAALVLGAGGSARQVEVAGATWSLAGAPTAVDQAEAALREAR